MTPTQLKFLRAEQRELLSVRDQIFLATRTLPRELALLEPWDQLYRIAFAHETLARCLRFRAGHGLFDPAGSRNLQVAKRSAG